MSRDKRPMQTRTGQLGVAALAISLVLLFGMTLVLYFVNRSMIFEQRTSANQYRATTAFEVAEAGLEWAAAMFNDQRFVNANCAPSAASGAVRFRERYAPEDSNFALVPVTDAQPGCSISGNALSCSCPAAGANPALGGNDPSFTVEFASVPGDTTSIAITSRGCTSQGTQCVPGSGQGASDATATVRAILKLRPVLRAAPAAALTVGGNAAVSGSFNITNTDLNSNGYLIDAGLDITLGSGTSLNTVPGTPLQNTLIKNDASLDQLASSDSTGDAMFNAFFGSTLDAFRTANTTKLVTGCSGQSCGAAVKTAYDQGYRSFYVNGDLLMNNGTGFGSNTIGSPTDPVTIVSSSDITFNGNFTIYGLIYSNNADWNANGTGNADIYGAVISRDNYQNNGNGTIRYDPNALRYLRDKGGLLVRLPGSWRDY